MPTEYGPMIQDHWLESGLLVHILLIQWLLHGRQDAKPLRNTRFNKIQRICNILKSMLYLNLIAMKA